MAWLNLVTALLAGCVIGFLSGSQYANVQGCGGRQTGASIAQQGRTALRDAQPASPVADSAKVQAQVTLPVSSGQTAAAHVVTATTEPIKSIEVATAEILPETPQLGEAGPMEVQFRCPDGNCKRVTKRCEQDHKPSSTCPKDDWVDEMIAIDPAPGKIIVNIGCNKGGDAVAWLQRWDQHNFWNLPAWIRNTGGGFCPAPKVVAPPKVHGASEYPVALCVEAVPKTVKHLEMARARLGYDSEGAPGVLHILHAAGVAQSTPGQTIPFSDAPVGFEGAGVSATGQGQKFGTVDVPAKTVDDLVEEYKFPRVDVLIVDTEGHDPAVLFGASKALESTRYVQFEVHRDIVNTAWANTTLFSVVQYLSNKGMDCYIAGNDGRTPSLTRCWNPQQEAPGMKNVVCVNRRDKWWPVLEKYSPGSHAD